MTQHYADFDIQVRAVLGEREAQHFESASRAMKQLFFNGLRPMA